MKVYKLIFAFNYICCTFFKSKERAEEAGEMLKSIGSSEYYIEEVDVEGNEIGDYVYYVDSFGLIDSSHWFSTEEPAKKLVEEMEKMDDSLEPMYEIVRVY